MLSSGALSSAISKRIVVKIGGKVSYCIHQKMNEIIRSVRLHFIVYIVPSIFARITKTVCQDNLTFDGQFIPFNPRRSRSCKSSAVSATVFLFHHLLFKLSLFTIPAIFVRAFKSLKGLLG